MADRLYKSKTDRMISGVSGGIAEYLDIDPTLVRVAWIVTTILTAGIAFIAYIALAIIAPERPAGESIKTGEAIPADDAESAPAGEEDALTSVRDHRFPERRRGLFAGITLIVIGVIFLSINFGIFDWFNWGRFWPVILIALGLWITMWRIGGYRRHD